MPDKTENHRTTNLEEICGSQKTISADLMATPGPTVGTIGARQLKNSYKDTHSVHCQLENVSAKYGTITEKVYL